MSLFAKILLSVLVVLMLIIISAIRVGKRRNRDKVALYLLIFAMLFTASSLFWTTDTAYDTETITHLKFGWPIPFMMQDQRYFNPPFPYVMRVNLSGMSGGTAFILGKLLFDIVINFIFAIASWWIAVSVISRRDDR
ncbi:MAG: hypothetical protein UY31_C0070G0007 [Candidatus Wolfebacteria bacterium GW2011_GWE1_48_7]|uniref:Uncharacterized protein n=1 Tax=Candidatus Wolfebacteria bacterium GW2011_GWB1_47_1 TaxID=1619007 RepID=A0A0G4AU15_9BACT|nr:MAG: hypothetical protein UX70_C0001G1011 [Candidatus Wolfebacteria bacterium GW2011_GWB1_47_1]KKU58804.1 MAG: hypothetical protein UX83_C0011G0016 [Candidatus Wolfebacteria bacterium GW2011_GWE2_47_12]KKU76878.1 MAG: hypothetical protein UY00_C0001G0013 [Candidatus Wolfebacteria bacterium GW2011_GWA1_47_6]KKU97718.1 MAG: hypothetical protein UY31_C0070G0007 [Candidatus Wolfebacteria bacterium GW2011_GWE1_48_7]HBD17680.1 hypothetical protein [Candidatus Wolfebacteria bacterium]